MQKLIVTKLKIVCSLDTGKTISKQFETTTQSSSKKFVKSTCDYLWDKVISPKLEPAQT